MNDTQPKPTGEWTVERLIQCGLSTDMAQHLTDKINAALSAAALEIKSLKAVEANYNETHQILTNAGVKHEGMDVAFRVNVALVAEREKHQ